MRSRCVIARRRWRSAQRSARIFIEIFVFVGFVVVEIQTALVVHVAPMRVIGVVDATLIAFVNLSVALQSLFELRDGGSGSLALRHGLDVASRGAGLTLCIPVIRHQDISRAHCCLGDGLPSKATILLSALTWSNL